MHRSILVACLAALGALPPIVTDAAARPNPAEKPGPAKASEIYVILKARLHEVDDAVHDKIAQAKWLSRAELEALAAKPPMDGKLFALLEKRSRSSPGRRSTSTQARRACCWR